MRGFGLFLRCFAMVAALAACPPEPRGDYLPPADVTTACVPNATQSCLCAGTAMTGVQTCASDGASFGACAGCPMPTACMAGTTRTCSCPTGGMMGTQTCVADGSTFGACGPCNTVARCGDGSCSGNETCSSCSTDCGACAARCGDGMCNGTETCSSCAADCGPCMSSPRCGDGTCNGAETCSTCSDDCGACPPRCGDAVCNGTETCSSCATDCGACETMCTPCSQDVDCGGGGAFCGVRRCDGTRGCYGSSSATCALIGGVRCPSTSAYNLCVSATECGPYADCTRFGDGRSLCARRCTVATDCPSAPDGFSGVTPTCDSRARVCYLRCDAPGACPFGLSCFRYSDGTYGYCS